jgi:hypothetical protein
MPRQGVLRLVFVLVCLSAAAAEASPCDKADVLGRARRAYPAPGPKSLEMSSSLKLHIDGRVEKKTFIERYRFPEMARFEYQGPVSVLVLGTNGKAVWRLTPEGPVPHSPGHFELPRRLRSFAWVFSSVTDAQVECVPGGREGTTRLLLTRGVDEMILLDIDAEGRVPRYEGESPATGATDVLQIDLDDWRRVGGHWVAYTVTTRVNGQPYAESKAESVRTDSDIPPSLFAAPTEVGLPPREL